VLELVLLCNTTSAAVALLPSSSSTLRRGSGEVVVFGEYRSSILDEDQQQGLHPAGASACTALTYYKGPGACVLYGQSVA
jgi:hypothetical protein